MRVKKHRGREAVRRGRSGNGRPGLPKVHEDHGEALTCQCLVQPVDRGQLPRTVCSPRAPEIHEHNTPVELPQVDSISEQVLQLYDGCGYLMCSP